MIKKHEIPEKNLLCDCYTLLSELPSFGIQREGESHRQTPTLEQSQNHHRSNITSHHHLRTTLSSPSLQHAFSTTTSFLIVIQ